MATPHELTENELNKVGVRIIKSEPLSLRCGKCAHTWPLKQKGLRLLRGYWKCPNGCNSQGQGNSKGIS